MNYYENLQKLFLKQDNLLGSTLNSVIECLDSKSVDIQDKCEAMYNTFYIIFNNLNNKIIINKILRNERYMVGTVNSLDLDIFIHKKIKDKSILITHRIDMYFNAFENIKKDYICQCFGNEIIIFNMYDSLINEIYNSKDLEVYKYFLDKINKYSLDFNLIDKRRSTISLFMNIIDMIEKTSYDFSIIRKIDLGDNFLIRYSELELFIYSFYDAKLYKEISYNEYWDLISQTKNFKKNIKIGVTDDESFMCDLSKVLFDEIGLQDFIEYTIYDRVANAYELWGLLSEKFKRILNE